MKRVVLLVVLLIFVLGTSCLAYAPNEARALLLQSKVEYDGSTLLSKIQLKDNFIVSLFNDSGFDLNYISPYGNTPLKFAALNNNIEATKILTSNPSININWKDSSGKAAIDIAYLFDNKEIVEILKSKGAEVSVSDKPKLSDGQIQTAISAGKTTAANKKDILFVEKDTDKTYGGFLGADVQTAGRAYWVTPYCSVANESLSSSKKYENVNSDKIKLLANSYQACVVFTLTNTNTTYLADGRIIAIQNGKVIQPYKVDSVPQQVTQQSTLFGGVLYQYRVGVIANFYAYDIDNSQPIEIKFVGKSSKELTFRFKNSNPIDFTQEESDEFKW